MLAGRPLELRRRRAGQTTTSEACPKPACVLLGQGETPMSGKKILIIDDDQHLLMGLTARLEANGYSVVSATDAISAIAVALNEAPDLVILDLGLPAGDGLLVLDRIKGLADLAGTPV